MLAVAAARNPADQVVPVGWRERQHLDELDMLASPGSFIRTKFGSIGCAARARRACVHGHFGGHRPQVLAVVEHLRVGHVVQAVDVGLEPEQRLRIAHVRAQSRGHRRRRP